VDFTTTTPAILATILQPFADRILDAMSRLHVPGVAVGLLYDGQEYTAGFGVTGVENPLPVTPNTLFQIGSTTKTVTGTIAMRLVEQGRLDLDAPVRTYLPDLRLADEAVAAQVTLRHLFTHTGGWPGDYFEDTGSGDDALARIVAQLHILPQQTPLGALFAYNNAGYYIAGRVIEVVTGRPYEVAARELVLAPLDMSTSYFFPSEIMTHRFAVGHIERDGAPTVARPWPIARSANAVGGLASTAIDQLRYARFHLGDGTAPDGVRLLSTESLHVMQSPQGPGGNDIDAFGITWMLRDLAGTPIVRHGGSTLGQISAFQFVPAPTFAITILTNADRGDQLTSELLAWAFEHYLGLRAPDEPVLARTTEQLQAYAGTYSSLLYDIVLTVQDGSLVAQDVPKGGFPDKDSPPRPANQPSRLAFVGPDRLIGLDPSLQGAHSEFLRDADGRLEWLRLGGRLLRRQE
jgi:CubicO group peptidase (beta-lactamase class C family)